MLTFNLHISSVFSEKTYLKFSLVEYHNIFLGNRGATAGYCNFFMFCFKMYNALFAIALISRLTHNTMSRIRVEILFCKQEWIKLFIYCKDIIFTVNKLSILKESHESFLFSSLSQINTSLILLLKKNLLTSGYIESRKD